MPLSEADYVALLDALTTSESRSELGRLRAEWRERLRSDARLAHVERMIDAKLARLGRTVEAAPPSQHGYDALLGSVARAADHDVLAELRQLARAGYHGRMLEELDARIEARARSLRNAGGS